tara:strand:- start:17 stop:499 length:483 start_codon:yes stop_codon:yes gene_type:complete
MHSLHLIRVNAESHFDAYSIVEDYLFDWVTENNWFTILGSHCKEDKSFSESFEERYVTKDELLNDPDRFNSLTNISDFYKEAFEKVVNFKGTVLVKSVDWTLASKYCKEQAEISNLLDPTKIDIWSDTFYDGSIDESGITELYTGADSQLTFIVLVDMHS